MLELIVGYGRPQTIGRNELQGLRLVTWKPANVCKQVSLNKLDFISCTNENQNQRNSDLKSGLYFVLELVICTRLGPG